MPALAITDSNNLFGALEFSEKLAKEGIQPIIGAAAHARFRRWRRRRAARGGQRTPGAPRSCCWPKDAAGYRNLMHLASRAWLDPEPGDAPHLRLARLDGADRRPDRADRRPDGPARPRLRAGAAGSRGCGVLERSAKAVSAAGSMSSCSAMAWRSERAIEPL